MSMLKGGTTVNNWLMFTAVYRFSLTLYSSSEFSIKNILLPLNRAFRFYTLKTNHFVFKNDVCINIFFSFSFVNSILLNVPQQRGLEERRQWIPTALTLSLAPTCLWQRHQPFSLY